ncbi:MAG: 1-deoxy-D-xylulose-5-phosphate reductoisomerase [Firmicutes bacterium]|nr:1-deoxy-D-xylulose-5-phosphate reductoisomerase [Bacillota bacterium]
MKNLSILGSTGSIGTQALDVSRRYPERFKVVALAANGNAELLAAQCREFLPSLVAVTDEAAYLAAKDLFPKGVRVAAGKDALETAATFPGADTVVAAVVGCAGFASVYEAVKLGKNVALANKEALVAGGRLITELAARTGATLLPIDSEHSAVWQCLMGSAEVGSRKEEVEKSSEKAETTLLPTSYFLLSNLKRILLTASGGAFYGKTKEELAHITPAQAVNHPNWKMGKKITVDCQTMMNKGLEIIEARWLFGTLNIDYIIHRESVIHSMVEFVDGSIIAQLSYPSMLYPIQLALSYPERLPTALPPYDFARPLTFAPPDEKVFFLPRLAKEALQSHQGAPLVLNAANEAAVQLFLNNRIGFTHIMDVVAAVMDSAQFPSLTDKESVIAAHNEWYERVLQGYKRYTVT